MSKIALRAYFHQIEKMIEGGSNDEALLHCRYILQTYPKCIEAYRNVAKALLEEKKYQEAKDVFSRVLSVYPDDFVSHIGMSIIREDEGNLDAAIWHMELAYDIQPSNPVLTEELRRLFGRRDGIQPPKIRMTRGALIRMYARGELFQQAISECLSTLQEDPSRVDIELILAQMYYLSGALFESAEVCSTILDQMPYCYEANRLMTEIIPRTSQAVAATIYKVKLSELDPYYAHITAPEMEPADIPDNAVLVELLDTDAQNDASGKLDLPESMITNWNRPSPILSISQVEPGASVGAELPNSPEKHDTQPLAPIKVESQENQDDFIQKEIDALDKDTNANYTSQEIPDWIRNAGWSPADKEAENTLDNSTLSAENGNVNQRDAEEASVPDWLKNAGPLENRQPGMNTANKDEAEEDRSEIYPLSPLKEEDLNPKEPPNSVSVTNEPETQIPIPIQGETGETMPSDSINKNEDEWLNQFRDDPSQKGEQNDLPDWLKDFETENEQPLEENMDIPEWLKSLEPVEPAAPQSSAEPLEKVAPPEVAAPVETESAIASTSYVFTKVLSEGEAKAANLETTMLAPEPETPAVPAVEPVQNVAVPETPKPVTESSVGLPSWVRNILKPQTPPAPPSEAAAEIPPSSAEVVPAEEELVSEPPQVPVEETPQNEIPPLPVAEASHEGAPEFGEEPIHELPAEVPAEGAISSDTSSELLDWLRGFGDNEEQPVATAVATPPETPASEIPVPPTEESYESMRSFIEPEAEVPPVAEVEPIQESQPMAEKTEEIAAELPVESGPAKADETSWFEELPQEAATPVTPEETAPEMMESSETEPVAHEEFTPAEAEEQPRPVIEEPIPAEAETAPVQIEEPAPIQAQEPAAVPVVPDPLSVAMNALNEGDTTLAVNEFQMALQDETKVQGLIESLKTATEAHGENSDLWQLLGDAYARTNQFGDAFTAYDRAESTLLNLK